MEVVNLTIKKLLTKYKEISLLDKISALLSWDLNVNLPAKGASERAAQSEYLAELITSKWLDKEFRSLVEKAQTESNLNLIEKAILRMILYSTKLYYRVPKDLIIKKEKVTSEAFLVWKQAREDNDFNKFLPFLEEIINLNREIANYLGYKDNPYDALLDRYNPEITANEYVRLFDGIKNGLLPLIAKIKNSENYSQKITFINNEIIYPIYNQKKLAEIISAKMGYDFAAGRMDSSPHPFTTTLGSHDIRLTNHYNLNDFTESIISIIHETGHGIYEQQIDSKYADTPLGTGVSLGIHESMSRFWENMVGKNPIFLRSIKGLLKEYYEEQLENVTDEEIVLAFNQVKPSLIRIHADEVTYSLHIILRFEMENELINGKISAKDAPDAWAAKSKTLLGIEPATDSEGVLQDVHWTYGDFGYFPSYALGNLYGAQFLEAMDKEINFDETLKLGNLALIKNWLDKNIHTHGSLYFPNELLKNATGKELDYIPFINYLNKKYSAIYA